jgi:RNA polymerase sigma-70 factor (ECF subfamily)
MELEEEKALIEQAKKDPRLFGPLYEANYRPIFGYVLRRTANVDMAQDITSEVFIRALSNLHRYYWRGIPFSAWLYRIASNEIAACYNRNGHEKAVVSELSVSGNLLEGSPEDEVERAEQEVEKYHEYLAVQAAIKKLPDKFQEVIALRYFEKKQLSEIAAITGRPESSVKATLYRGLEKLRRLVHNATFA